MTQKMKKKQRKKWRKIRKNGGSEKMEEGNLGRIW